LALSGTLLSVPGPTAGRKEPSMADSVRVVEYFYV